MRLITEEALAVATIMQEAEGEPYSGKLGVAEVIRNRMTKRYSSDGTVHGTVLRYKQFSGWNENTQLMRRSLQIDDENNVVRDCIKAWREAMSGSNTVHGAVLYYNPDPRLVPETPDWAMPDSAIEVAVIGQHHFFIPKPRPGTVKV